MFYMFYELLPTLVLDLAGKWESYRPLHGTAQLAPRLGGPVAARVESAAGQAPIRGENVADARCDKLGLPAAAQEPRSGLRASMYAGTT